MQDSENLKADQVSASGVRDLQTALPERPEVTPDMIAEAAAELARREGWNANQASDLARAYRGYMDGYELAKELENYSCWTISVMDVEALDCMSSDVQAAHRKACVSWARENNIQPPLPIGAMTTRGEITGISEYEPATYLIREHGETNEGRRLLVKFEDARAAIAATAE